MNKPKKILHLLLIISLLSFPLLSEEQTKIGNFDFQDDYDIGCSSERPALCSDGDCYENYSFCQPLRGCTSQEAPILCPSGVCTLDFGLCDQTSYACELAELNRCPDGICRLNCDFIHTNGCPVDLPFYCPSGLCVKNRLECTRKIIRLALFF